MAFFLIEEDGHGTEELFFEGAELDVGQFLSEHGNERGDVAHGLGLALGIGLGLAR